MDKGNIDKKLLRGRITKQRNKILKTTRAKYGTRQLLRVLMQFADNYENRVCISKETMCDEACLCERTVKAGLKFLKAEGTIVATAYAKGGRGKATVYKFEVPVFPDDIREEFTGDAGQLWSLIFEYFRARRATVFARWIVKLRPDRIEGRTLHLIAESEMVRDHVLKTYEEEIRRELQKRSPTVDRIRISTGQ